MSTYNITDTIGKTPLIHLPLGELNLNATILIKQESRNPLGSIKDRVALAMIDAGFKDGTIDKNTTIIEPTSGNTGLGLAFICAARKLKLILTMPETMSIERRKLLKQLGAELVLTQGDKGMKGAIASATEIQKKTANSTILDQFGNPACPDAHRKTTGPEIWEQCNGNIDYFIAGVGTGGTITGVAEYIKERNPNLQAIAVEPADSPVLSGGIPGPHKIQGIGAGFIPDVLNTEIIDEIITVQTDDAFATARMLASSEGLLCGISSGAAAWAAIQVAGRAEAAGKTIVTVLPDTGERYISTPLMNEEE